MAEKLLKFISIDQAMPEKRDIAIRKTDFNEIYQPFASLRATEQAARCSQCGVPFCQAHCPLGNNIPDWLRLTAEGRLEEAYELSSATNSFPEICGRICPQDRLCEGNCVIEKGFQSVTIGAVEKFITDTAFEQGWVRPPTPTRALNQSVGIIGAGPAGLAAAEFLCRKGYTVHVYDRYDRVGGLLVYGIPGFKLDKTIVARRHALLVEGGVTFHLNFEIGRDAHLADLQAKHDAILIATGVYRPRVLSIPGDDLANVIPALDYLTANNRRGLGDVLPDGVMDAAGKHVVVIGGGDTAMDCVRTAVRQQAASVTCLYRRDRRNMPGSLREVAHAEEEGVTFVWQAAPERFTGTLGRINTVHATRIHLGVADGSGRQVPQIVPDSAFTLPADLVITALGFDAEPVPTLFDAPTLKLSRWGTIEADPKTGATNLDGVYAAGDIVRGASLVVWAIHDGRICAAAMDKRLTRKRAIPSLAAE